MFYFKLCMQNIMVEFMVFEKVKILILSYLSTGFSPKRCLLDRRQIWHTNLKLDFDVGCGMEKSENFY